MCRFFGGEKEVDGVKGGRGSHGEISDEDIGAAEAKLSEEGEESLC